MLAGSWREYSVSAFFPSLSLSSPLFPSDRLHHPPLRRLMQWRKAETLPPLIVVAIVRRAIFVLGQCWSRYLVYESRHFKLHQSCFVVASSCRFRWQGLLRGISAVRRRRRCHRSTDVSGVCCNRQFVFGLEVVFVARKGGLQVSCAA